METSGFFTSLNEDRKYLAKQFADFFSTFIGNGVFGNPANQLKVYQHNGMNVRINDGCAFLNGYWYRVDNSEEVTTVTIPANTTSSTVKVYVKLLLDESSARTISVGVTTDATVTNKSKILAVVSVPPSATTITNSMIQDTRFDSTKCGVVKGLIDQIDTTDFFNQYTAAFEEEFGELGDVNERLSQLSDEIENILKNEVILNVASFYTWGDGTYSSYTDENNNTCKRYYVSDINSASSIGGAITPSKDISLFMDSNNIINVSASVLVKSGDFTLYLLGKKKDSNSDVYYPIGNKLSVSDNIQSIEQVIDLSRIGDSMNIDVINKPFRFCIKTGGNGEHEALFYSLDIIAPVMQDRTYTSDKYTLPKNIDNLGKATDNLESRVNVLETPKNLVISSILKNEAILNASNFYTFGSGTYSSYTDENNNTCKRYYISDIDSTTTTGGAITPSKDISSFKDCDNFIKLSANIFVKSGEFTLYLLGKKKDGADGVSDVYYQIANKLSASDEIQNIDEIIDLNHVDVYTTIDIEKPFRFCIKTGGNGEHEALFYSLDIIAPVMQDRTYTSDKYTLPKNIDNLGKATDNLESRVKYLENASNTEVKLFDANGNSYSLYIENGEIKLKNNFVDNIFYIGNSLLLGFDEFGMAASNINEDYYAYVNKHITDKGVSLTVDRIGCPYESYVTETDQDNWISGTLAPKLNADMDVVIVQLGDNVNTVEKKEAFKTSCPKLLKAIKIYAPNAKILFVAAWWQNAENSETIIKSCIECGAKFVDISDLISKSENRAKVGDIITRTDGTTFEITSSGVADHPSSLGMKRIAERIIANL